METRDWHVKILFQHCCIIQRNCSNEDTDRCKKVDDKDKLQKFLRAPDGLKQLPDEKESNCTNHCPIHSLFNISRSYEVPGKRDCAGRNKSKVSNDRREKLNYNVATDKDYR
uniref:Uncharacterized protein n=1 Tax=Opuntia streptacantha TaxID=393608 RepID=A0A7C9ELZ0_OPUST